MILYPLYLFLLTRILITLGQTETTDRIMKAEKAFFPALKFFVLIIVPLLIVRGIIVFQFQKQIMFSLSGAEEITRKQYPEIYNIVENLCISRGLPLPKIWIIKTPGRNAFSTWRKEDDIWIVFTSGLLEHLNPREIEAVAAHEISHILKGDSKLMFVSVVFISIFSLIGRYLLRKRQDRNYIKTPTGGIFSSSFGSVGTSAIGYLFITIGSWPYILIRYAISRNREYLSDVGAVQLTKDHEAMISALKKIEWCSSVPAVIADISVFFIDNTQPSVQEVLHKRYKPMERKPSSILDTHPTLYERVKALERHFPRTSR